MCVCTISSKGRRGGRNEKEKDSNKKKNKSGKAKTEEDEDWEKITRKLCRFLCLEGKQTLKAAEATHFFAFLS